MVRNMASTCPRFYSISHQRASVTSLVPNPKIPSQTPTSDHLTVARGLWTCGWSSLGTISPSLPSVLSGHICNIQFHTPCENGAAEPGSLPARVRPLQLSRKQVLFLGRKAERLLPAAPLCPHLRRDDWPASVSCLIAVVL